MGVWTRLVGVGTRLVGEYMTVMACNNMRLVVSVVLFANSTYKVQYAGDFLAYPCPQATI